MDKAGTKFDLQAKACAEALQNAQKRTRIALLLSLAASCIVLLMVLNLFESYQLRNTRLVQGSPSSSPSGSPSGSPSSSSSDSEYLKEFSKHIAQNSFYQIPALGIQITCDDVGLLGPLVLFMFSAYLAMAFKARDTHVQCAAMEHLGENYLIATLLETEHVPESPAYRFRTIRTLQGFMLFLPSIACMIVTGYGIYAHFLHHRTNGDLSEIFLINRAMAICLDAFGWIFTLAVLFQNKIAHTFLRKSQKTIHNTVDTNAKQR